MPTALKHVLQLPNLAEYFGRRGEKGLNVFNSFFLGVLEGNTYSY